MPRGRHELAKLRVGPFVVVAIDPNGDDGGCLVEGLEAMLPDALALERLVICFDHAILFGRVKFDVTSVGSGSATVTISDAVGNLFKVSATVP